jgi:hypothetical protein
MNTTNIKTNIYFIVPITLCLAFYGSMLINGGPFTKLFMTMLCLGILPYGILWFLASRLPEKAGLCKIGSTTIFLITAFMAAKYLFFTNNVEEAMGLLVLPVLALRAIGFFILLLPFVPVIIYIRRRLRRKTEIAQQ